MDPPLFNKVVGCFDGFSVAGIDLFWVVSKKLAELGPHNGLAVNGVDHFLIRLFSHYSWVCFREDVVQESIFVRRWGR
jgi:hypothetical protein